MEVDKVIGIFMVSVILLGLGYLVWDWGIQEYIQFHEGADAYCKEKGYDEMTSYINKDCPWGGEEYRMYCDEEKMFYTVDITWCIERDKFGTCREEGYTFYDYDGNATC